MIIFVKNFIDTGASVGKHEHLVKALVDLIQKDQSISGETEFYIGENGEKIKKVALGDLKKVCLPSFLLGVWHYVVLNRGDNSVGRITYDLRSHFSHTANAQVNRLKHITVITIFL